MTEFMSFVDFQITVYRGSRAIKSSPEPKTVCYSPRKWPEMTKFTSFVDFQITVYWGSRAVEIIAEPKQRAMAHENGQK